MPINSNILVGGFLDSAAQSFRPVPLAIGSNLVRISLEAAEVEYFVVPRRTEIAAHPILHEILLVPSGIQPLLAGNARHFDPYLTRGWQHGSAQQNHGDHKEFASHDISPLSDR